MNGEFAAWMGDRLGATGQRMARLARVADEIAAAPPCVVRHCPKVGLHALVAEESGRYGGRYWLAGERVDVCGAHYILATNPGGPDELAEWERDDLSVAQPSPLRLRRMRPVVESGASREAVGDHGR